MNSSRFDDLTKALATSTSRRQALQRIGGTLAGSLLAAWPFTQALAAGGGNSQCAHFCASVFGADTPAAGQCTSDAAHGKGLCYSCGSSTPASSICCTRNSRGFCSSYSPTLPCSCGTNQTCQNGTCVATCLGLQQPCTSPSQCCDTGQGQTTCAYDDQVSGGVFACCNREGGSCNYDADCCTGYCSQKTCYEFNK